MGDEYLGVFCSIYVGVKTPDDITRKIIPNKAMSNLGGDGMAKGRPTVERRIGNRNNRQNARLLARLSFSKFSFFRHNKSDIIHPSVIETLKLEKVSF